MKHRVHLALPPNVVRHVHNEFAHRFPALGVDSPGLHREMFDFALTCGKGRPPALSVSAYPQLTQNVLHFGSSAFSSPKILLPPLRSELVSLGLAPPCNELTVVAVVPCLLIGNAEAAPTLDDWQDLCNLDDISIIGIPPLDTPLPYLVAAFLETQYGERANRAISRFDTTSMPLDINKRVASGEFAAGVVIPAFGRSFRTGCARMVWPRSGALAVPLVACVGADAPEEAHRALDYLLSPEMQSYLASSGGLVSIRADVSGFPELEAADWGLIWPGWDELLHIGDVMNAILCDPCGVHMKKAWAAYCARSTKK